MFKGNMMKRKAKLSIEQMVMLFFIILATFVILFVIRRVLCSLDLLVC